MARSLAGTGAGECNFDLLRLGCAVTVIASHAFPLTTGITDSEPFLRYGLTPGGCAVLIFFAVSGFLIAGSFDRQPDLPRFAAARARRIYPAYIVVLLLSTLLLGAAVTALPVADYYRHPAVLGHLAANALFDTTAKELPGVFTGNPHRGTVNGSLWSLPLEVLCYCLLYGAGRARLLRPRRCLALVLAGLGLCGYWRVTETAGALPHVLPSFLTGVALYVYRERVPASPLLFVLLIVLCLAAPRLAFHEELVRVTIGYGALCFATGSSWAGRYITARGDYSYGLYLYGWPVTQVIVAALPRLGVGGVIALALPITAALAFASWHLVEKRALGSRERDGRRRRSEPAGRPSLGSGGYSAAT